MVRTDKDFTMARQGKYYASTRILLCEQGKYYARQGFYYARQGFYYARQGFYYASNTGAVGAEALSSSYKGCLKGYTKGV
jgi:hypothetical protein